MILTGIMATGVSVDQMGLSLGEIIGFAAAAAAIVGLIMTLVATGSRLGQMAGKLEAGLKAQNDVIHELKDEIGSLRKVVTDIAVFRAELNNQGALLVAMNKRLDDLSHGRGFIAPFPPNSSAGG